ncbi:MAG: glycosyltransferase [Bacteroidales bacterium]|jgi:sugar transferase (PEP-CTERM/EpsH1 system associated)
MRIFILLSRIPYPLEKGDKLRAFHQIKELSKNNEIILCALNPVSKIDKQKAFSSLQPYCRSINFLDLPLHGRLINMARAFFSKIPFQSGFFYNRSAAREIQRLIKEYKPDHIYCQLIRTAEYVKNIPIKKTIDYQDVFSHGMKRRIATSPFFFRPFVKLEFNRLYNYESHVFDLFDHHTIISIPDRDLIPHQHKNRIKVVLNGVDHEFFKPQHKEKTTDVVFTGNMAYPPNVDAAVFLAKEIMPLVWKAIPEATLLLAGASPDHRVTALKSDKIKVSGWMDDIREAYATSRVFIAPMRIGTGLQNKLLEAMSMKLPTITTPLANSALNAIENMEILVGEEASSLADHLIKLLTNQDLYSKIAENGHQFVLKNYNWEEATHQLEELLNAD